MTMVVSGSRGVVDHDVSARVRAVLEVLGEKETAARMGMSRVTLGRVAGGLTVWMGTIAACKASLPGVESELRNA